MEIKPTYVTFEQAKFLKEKGFDEDCSKMYKVQCIWGFGFMQYKNSQIHKNSFDTTAPEQWQVVEWLSLKGIEVSAQINFYNKKSKLGYYYTIDKFDENGIHDGKDYDMQQLGLIGDLKAFNTKQEAYSAAFDFILTNNLI